MKEIKINPYIKVIKSIPRKLYGTIFSTFLLMIIAGILEFLTLIIAYPFFTIISGQLIEENSNAKRIFKVIFFLNESNVMYLFIFSIIILSVVRIYNLKKLTNTNALIVNSISKKVFSNILSKEFEIISSYSASDLTNKLKTHIDLMGFCISLSLQFISALITSLLIIFGLTQLAFVEMLSILTGLSIFYIFIGSKLKNSLSRNCLNLTNSSKERMKIIRDSFALIKDIKLSNSSRFIIEEYSSSDFLERKAVNNNVYFAGYPRFVLEGFGYVLIISIAIFITATNKDQNSLAVIALLALGMQRLLPALQLIYSSWSNFTGNKLSFLIISDLLNQNINNKSAVQGLNFNKKLKLENLNFRYQKDGQFILKDISFEINRGEFIGIVGASGSGKSTLIDIMMGLLQPSGGKFFIDSNEINSKNWNQYKESIRSISGHVPQEVFLFNESVLSNICKFDNQKTFSLLNAIQSSKLANINNFIESLPDGYNHILRDNGSNLSGGQKQRIGIARALYSNPKILYLDESTSGLDSKSEFIFVQNLNALKGKMTIIFISHRIQSLTNCDRIFEINNGTIKENFDLINKN